MRGLWWWHSIIVSCMGLAMPAVAGAAARGTVTKVKRAVQPSTLRDVSAARMRLVREKTHPRLCGGRNCSTVVAMVGIPGSGRMETVRFTWGQGAFTAGRYRFQRIGPAKGVNTTYLIHVREPRGRWVGQGHAILAWKVPLRTGGRWVDATYTPYAPALHRPEIARHGQDALRGVVGQARARLDRGSVRSKLEPRRLVTGVVPASTTRVIAVVEKIDHAEFRGCMVIRDARRRSACVRRLAEVPAVVLALNGSSAYRYAVSGAAARGFMQFTCGSWEMVRRAYPRARLLPCAIGSRIQTESVVASILLNDYNLTLLDAAHARRLRRSPEGLTLYSAAAYNGNPTWAIRAIDRCRSQWMDPRRCGILRPETVVYMQKVQAVWAIAN